MKDNVHLGQNVQGYISRTGGVYNNWNYRVKLYEGVEYQIDLVTNHNNDTIYLQGASYSNKYSNDLKVLTKYTLNIGYQKPTTNITGYTHITDKIEFGAQDNYYSIVPYSNENMVLHFSDIEVGNSVKVTLYDSDDNELFTKDRIVRGDEVELTNIVKGQDYKLLVEGGVTPYTIDVTYK